MLALAIGGCTVAELQQRMSAEEFGRWWVFYERRPFGPMLRPDLRPAAAAADEAMPADVAYQELKSLLMIGAAHAGE